MTMTSAPSAMQTRKRPAGTGTIRKRNGSWSYLLRVTGDDGRVRTLSASGFATRGQAESAARKARADADRGKLPARRSAGTLSAWLTEWLTTVDAAVAAGARKPTTARHHRFIAERYLIPAIGSRPVGKLSAADVAAAFVSIRESGGKGGRTLSPATVRHCSTTLHKALAAAVQAGTIPAHPMARLTDEQRAPAPQRDHDEIHAWTAEQADRFVGVCVVEGSPEALALAAAVRTGVRRGELVGLRWSDVAEVERSDGTRAGRISVRRSIVMVDGQRIESTPKSAAGRRAVPIGRSVLDLFDLARRRQAEHRLVAGEAWEGPQAGDGTAPVFRTPLGQALHPQGLRHVLDRLARRAEIPRLSVHGLRHTFATIALVEQRIPVAVVSRWLGHASPSITLSVYAHVLDDVAEDYADQLGEAFAPVVLAGI
jgi:integrase